MQQGSLALGSVPSVAACRGLRNVERFGEILLAGSWNAGHNVSDYTGVQSGFATSACNALLGGIE